MEEENNILTSLAQCKDLINCDVVSTQLSAILTGLCDIINEQHVEIRSLKRSLAEKENSYDKIEAAVEAQKDELINRLKIDITEMKESFLNEVTKLSSS